MVYKHFIQINIGGTAIDRLSILWKSDLSGKIKWEFFVSTIVRLHHFSE